MGAAQKRRWAGSVGPGEGLGKGPLMFLETWEAPPILGSAWPPAPAPELLGHWQQAVVHPHPPALARPVVVSGGLGQDECWKVG